MRQLWAQLPRTDSELFDSLVSQINAIALKINHIDGLNHGDPWIKHVQHCKLNIQHCTQFPSFLLGGIQSHSPNKTLCVSTDLNNND